MFQNTTTSLIWIIQQGENTVFIYSSLCAYKEWFGDGGTYLSVGDHLHEMTKEYDQFHQHEANVDETLSGRKISAAKPPSGHSRAGKQLEEWYVSKTTRLHSYLS